MGKKLPFWRKHKITLLCCRLVVLCFVCYCFCCGCPFSSWSVNDMEQFIPGKYRHPTPSPVVKEARELVSNLSTHKTKALMTELKSLKLGNAKNLHAKVQSAKKVPTTVPSATTTAKASPVPIAQRATTTATAKPTP